MDASVRRNACQQHKFDPRAMKRLDDLFRPGSAASVTPGGWPAGDGDLSRLVSVDDFPGGFRRREEVSVLVNHFPGFAEIGA